MGQPYKLKIVQEFGFFCILIRKPAIIEAGVKPFAS
jgi:hypothetical protein